MNCQVCGSEEFVTNDGITYCTECQSQIEETQTEIAVEVTFSKNIGPAEPKKTTRKKKLEYSDWITVECFNHILYMQVSALTELGASAKLKNTVLHIWSKYLEKCEIAFQIDYLAEKTKPRLGSKPYNRDLKVLYGSKKNLKRKWKKSNKSDAEPAKNPSVDEGLSIEDDTESNTDADMSVCSEDKFEKQKYSSHARKVLGKKRCNDKHFKKVFNMTLAKTLSICYLGLLYTEDQLSLFDFIRFVREEKIPYLDLVDKLPSTLKLDIAGDYAAFLTHCVPDAYSILRTSRKIMHFLNLPEYKKPSVFSAAARLTKDLNLPDDILPIIKTLIERYKEEIPHYGGSVPNIENIPSDIQALASILVAMKMLFVLDDKFEIEHSKAMSKLNAIYTDRRYFEWKEWKEHTMVKEFLYICEKTNCFAISNIDSLSANLIISKYPFTRLKSRSTEEQQNSRDPVKLNINKILSELVHIPSSNPKIPTSFPLRRTVHCLMEEWRTLPMFKETKEIDFTLLRKDFSSCSLSFNPLQFDKVEEELSHLLMTSLYLPDTCVTGGRINEYPLRCHTVVCTTSSYWILNFSEREYGKSEITSDWLNKLPKSFKWLLNFFSKYMYCNSVTLYKEVVTMEKILFLRTYNLLRNDKFKYKINVNF